MLAKLLATCYRYCKLTLTIGLLTALLGLGFSWKYLTLEVDWPYVLGHQDPLLESFYLQRTEFKLPSDIAILISQGSSQQREEAVEHLQKMIEQNPKLYQSELSSVPTKDLYRHALTFLSENSLKELLAKIQEAHLAQKPIQKMISLPGPQAVPAYWKELDKEQKSALLILANQALNELKEKLEQPSLEQKNLPWWSGFQLKPEQVQVLEGKSQIPLEFASGHIRVLLVKPIFYWEHKLSPALPTIQHLRSEIELLKKQYPGLRFRVAGDPVLITDERMASQRDSTKSVLLSALLILFLFAFSFGNLRIALGSFLSLVLGLSWTLGLTTLIVGHFNFITVTITTVLMGLGIDFCIHICFRYNELFQKEKIVESVWQKLAPGTGRDNILGAFVTCGVFLTFCFYSYRGVYELGIIACIGILSCLLASLTMQPAFLALLHDGRSLTLQEMLPFWSNLEKAWSEHDKTLLTAFFLLTCALLYPATQTYFDFSVLNLQDPNNESVKTEKELLAIGHSSALVPVLLVETPHQAKSVMAKLETLNEVDRCQSLAEYFPESTPTKQEILTQLTELSQQLTSSPNLSQDSVFVIQEGIAQMLQDPHCQNEHSQEIKQLGENFQYLHQALKDRGPGPVSDAIRHIAEHNRYRYTNFRRFLQHQSSEPLTLDQIPQNLKDRYITSSGYWAIRIYPSQNPWEKKNLDRFVKAIQPICSEHKLVGDALFVQHYTDLVWQNYLQTSWSALAVMLTLALFHFRKISSILLALSIPVSALIWTRGLMYLFGIPINPASYISQALLLGFGMVFSVHVLHRLEKGEHHLLATAAAPAVMLSGLTTVIGFGSLVTASHLGIKSFGQMISLGMLMNLIFNLILLPSLYRFFFTKRPEVNPKREGES